MPENFGIVIIGRNEGERLHLCFESMSTVACTKIYVDSGSTDHSLAIANDYAIEAIELNPTFPFSAARARNEGFERLLQLNPNVVFVQFIDGDCTLLPRWLETATDALSKSPERAAVIGHLIERNIEASPYNKLCALEWRSSPGDLTNYGALGGISMMRTDIFSKLGGFNPDVIAGEDSELGVRMGLAGYKITKLDQPMATHDANIIQFGQWWKRAVRAGHAIGQRSFLNGKTAQKDCVRERNSTLFWGAALPTLILLGWIPTQGYSFILLSAYFLLAYRVIKFRSLQGDNFSDAWLYAKYLLLSKFANAIGLVKFYLNKLSERYEIIEYK
ncbi:glycosyltransferase family A protein [Methyloglobulus sp.]|uniref:glycosyltransferase n=1 Tax=Methyloglobulus sp. TaxID=2518622 RepID=UPI0032B7CE28